MTFRTYKIRTSFERLYFSNMLFYLSITFALVATTRAAPTEGCKNLNTDCNKMAEQGFCVEPEYRIVCPLACGVCTCKDAMPNCAVFKDICFNDPSQVLFHNCKASCGFCECKDKPSVVGCANFKLHKQCLINDIANFECPATCGFCQPIP